MISHHDWLDQGIDGKKNFLSKQVHLFQYREHFALERFNLSKRWFARLEDEKQRQANARNSLFDKNRNLTFTSLAKNASKRDIVFDNDNNSEDEDEGVTAAIDAAAVGQKDNSRKAYYKEFRKVLETADVILEVLDARDPLGCRTKQVEKLIIESGSSKRIILVLNKIDLVPRENITQWLIYLRKEFPTVAFKSSTQSQRKNLGHSSSSVSTASDNIIKHSNECLGADTLITLLKNYSRSLNIKTSITVGVIGFPNVGKSSVINSLKRSKVCGVGASPGLTKSAQEIHLDKNIKLLDCPGIVFTRNQWGDGNAEILLRNCIKVELLDDPIPPVELIVSRCRPEQLMSRYSVPMFRNTNEFLLLLARQRGKLRRGGIPDIDSAAKIVLHDWNSGKIPYYTVPPTTAKDNVILDSTIVSTWSKEFNLNEVCNETEDQTILASVKTNNDFGSSAIVMTGEFPEVEMDEFLDNDDSQSDKIPEAIPMDVEEKSTELVVPQMKPKTVTFANPPQQIFSKLELELNPQVNKNKKKESKKAKKASKKKDQMKSDDTILMEEDLVKKDDETRDVAGKTKNEDHYDFSEFFGKLS
ncbi:3340_t:CDS:2 [Funneliformis geosporum]|uniref:545_t:CDS:1 n=1 Tax=Funneliformis geosporum TaxID=1117311 RepID=A0A9W4STA9_9GLOM|nr:3340_t:CDS:2 [Funneliformis geosporum]CAI2179826.1 545_t:CDS:2 [Funneliformis geosporum]